MYNNISFRLRFYFFYHTMDYFLYISTKTTSIAPTVRFCSDCDTHDSYPFSGSIPQDFSEKHPNILSWVGLLFVSLQSNRNSLFRYRSETTKLTVPKKANKTGKKRKKRKNSEKSWKKWQNMLPIKLFRLVSVCFGSIETSKLSVSVLKRKNRNKRFVSDSAETSFGSSFGCFEPKLFSKDTLPLTNGSVSESRIKCNV